MATDLHFYYGQGHRRAFHLHANSADARNNGVVVVPAAEDATIYVTGWDIGNDTAGAIVFQGASNAGTAGVDLITPDIHVATVDNRTRNYLEPLSVGFERPFGFVASAIGNVGFEAWGYYAAPTENPDEQSQSMSQSASVSGSMSKSLSQSKSQSQSKSASLFKSVSQSKSQSKSGIGESAAASLSKSKSLSQSKSQSMSQSGSKSASKAESLSAWASQSQSKSRSMSASVFNQTGAQTCFVVFFLENRRYKRAGLTTATETAST